MTEAQTWLGWFYMMGIVFRGALVIVLAVSVIAVPKEFIPAERYGYGLAAGGAFMTLPVLWNGGGGTAFDGWAGMVCMGGVLIAISARLYRGFRHKRANEQMMARAKARARKT